MKFPYKLGEVIYEIKDPNCRAIIVSITDELIEYRMLTNGKGWELGSLHKTHPNELDWDGTRKLTKLERALK